MKWSLPSLSDVKRAQRSTFQSSYVQVAVNFRFIYVHQLVQLAVTVNDRCCQFEIFPDEFSPRNDNTVSWPFRGSRRSIDRNVHAKVCICLLPAKRAWSICWKCALSVGCWKYGVNLNIFEEKSEESRIYSATLLIQR